MKYKKSLVIIFLSLVSVLLLLVPWSAPDLYIRFHFGEIKGDKFQLFYTTDDSVGFNEEECITALLDREKGQVTFKLDKSVCEELTGLRLDFPPIQDVLEVKSITVSSAGVIQEEYNPVSFFSSSNIAMNNGIEVSLVNTRNRAYIVTSENDPYVVLGQEAVQKIVEENSHFFMTRCFTCIFIWGCFFFYKKDLFKG